MSAVVTVVDDTSFTLAAAVTASLSVVGPLTAKAGGTQANATPLTANFNLVGTVASAGDAVGLPLGVAGMDLTVANGAAANSMQVFVAPGATDTINGVAAATGVAHAANKSTRYVCYTSAPGAKWFSQAAA